MYISTGAVHNSHANGTIYFWKQSTVGIMSDPVLGILCILPSVLSVKCVLVRENFHNVFSLKVIKFE
jgi:hypothetical protein